MRFAFASCQNYTQGFFPAYADIAEQDLDLVTYADTPSEAFELLRDHLIEHHLEPPTAQEAAAPGIAKTRG